MICFTTVTDICYCISRYCFSIYWQFVLHQYTELIYLVIYRILSDSIIDCSLSGAFLSISDHFISIYWFQLLILFLSFGSPDDWECFLHYLGCLLEDDSNWCNRAITDPIYPSKFVECKISNLTDEVVHITLSLIVFFPTIENWSGTCLQFNGYLCVSLLSCAYFLEICFCKDFDLFLINWNAVWFSYVKCIRICTKVARKYWQ